MVSCITPCWTVTRSQQHSDPSQAHRTATLAARRTVLQDGFVANDVADYKEARKLIRPLQN